MLFILTSCRSSPKIKVAGQSSRSQDEKVSIRLWINVTAWRIRGCLSSRFHYSGRCNLEWGHIFARSLLLCGSVVWWLGRPTCDSMVVSSIPGRRAGTEMVNRLGAGIPPRYVTRRPAPRPTQPSTLYWTGNKYRPKWGDALRLGVKAVLLIPFVNKRVGGRFNCVIHLTSAILRAWKISFVTHAYLFKHNRAMQFI